MSGHQLVGVDPARQIADALEPGADARIIGPRYAELVGPVQVPAHRDVRDRRLVANSEGALSEVGVEHTERALYASPQELVHLRFADLGEGHHPARSEEHTSEL